MNNDPIIKNIGDDMTEVKTRLSNIDVTMAVQSQILSRQEVTLVDHTARSLANERRIKKVEDAWLVHMAKLSGVMSFFKGLGLLVGIISVILQILWNWGK